MLKLILICMFFLTSTFSATSVDKKISSRKKELSKQKQVKNKATVQVKILAKQITKQTNELKKLEREIVIVNKDISQHQKMLNSSQNKLQNLKKTSKRLKREKEGNEEHIVDIIIEDFASSIAIKLANENSLKELIDSEIYTLLSENSKDSLLKLNSQYMNVTQDTRDNERNVSKLTIYINKREKKRIILTSLKNKHNKALKSLEGKHIAYQKELKRVINKQKTIQSLLSKLNIVKDKEIKKQKVASRKERARLAALKKKHAKEDITSNSSEAVTRRHARKIDLDVRMLGSSTKGVKISKYRGKKTIAPLKSYTIIKKFGKYYDPVYKIKLFNESIVLKSKTHKSKVYSVLNGKIVYAKKNAGILHNVVIVQHKNGLHTIYSHLDQISPTLKVGKWIKKGYVVGRVDDTLTFQATKNNAHINPQDLFN